MSEASLWLPEGAQTPGFQRVCSDLNKLGNGLNGDSVICSVMGEFAQIKCSWGNLTSIFPARQYRGHVSCVGIAGPSTIHS